MAISIFQSLGQEGRVVGWGSYLYGESEAPGDLGEVVQVAAGASFGVALQADGKVREWGQVPFGRKRSGFVTVAVGLDYKGLGLRPDGTLVSWAEYPGQEMGVPPGLKEVVAISHGARHAAAVTADGRLVVWGDNSSGQLNVPPGLSNVVAVACGNAHTLALLANRTVVAWGYNFSGESQVPSGLTNVVSIEARFEKSYAVRADGSLVKWGYVAGAEDVVPAALSQVVAVAGGRTHGVALKRDGALVAWGVDHLSQTKVPPSLGRAAAVTAGQGFTLALLRSAGPWISLPPVPVKAEMGDSAFLVAQVNSMSSVACQWRFNGTNLPGQTNRWLRLAKVRPEDYGEYRLFASNEVGAVLSGPVYLEGAFAAKVPLLEEQNVLLGDPTTLVLQGAELWSRIQWRHNGQDIPGQTNASLTFLKVRHADGGLYEVHAVGPGGELLTRRAMISVGTVFVFDPPSLPRGFVLPGADHVIKAVGGAAHLMGLRGDGNVLVRGDTGGRWTTLPPEPGPFIGIAADSRHNLALRANGTVVGWGNDAWGAAIPPAGLGNVIAVTAGGGSSFAVRADGTFAAWGANTNLVPGLGNVVAIATGQYRSAVLRADGTVSEWGTSSFGSFPGTQSVSNVVQIAVTGEYLHALRADGSVIVWGARLAPVALAGWTNIDSLAGGGRTVALRTDGTLLFDTFSNLPDSGRRFAGISTTEYQVVGIVSDEPPVFSPPPPLLQKVVAKAGGPAVLRVAKRGALPMTFQWRLNGVDLPGKTNFVLWLDKVAPEHAGEYTLAARNEFGEAVSMAIPLEVEMGAIRVLRAPRMPPIKFGRDILLEASAVGPGVRYQWRRDGVDLAGATNSVLRLRIDSARDTRGYSLQISNVSGNVIFDIPSPLATPVVVWGEADPGLQRVPPGYEEVTIAAVSNGQGFMVTAGGELVTWGNPATNPPPSLRDVASISAHQGNWTAVTQGGEVVSWGNSSGLLDVPPGLSNVVSVSTTSTHVLALLGDGQVRAWGFPFYRELAAVPAGLSNVVAVAASPTVNLAALADGRLVSWGVPGVLNPPPGLSNVVAVAAGSGHRLALLSDGTVAAWGVDLYGETKVPPGLDEVVSVVASDYYSLALRADGSVVEWGGGATRRQSQPAGLEGITLAAANPYVTIVAKGGQSPIPPRLGPNRAGLLGGKVFFHPEVVTARPISCQWRRNGIDLPGRTNTWLYLEGLTPADAGEYSLAVTNQHGGAVSDAVRLDLLPLRLATSPVDQELLPGATARFAAEIEGSGVEYQWFHDGVELPGRTNSSLVISNVQPADVGRYFARGRGVFGELITPLARLGAPPLFVWGYADPAISQLVMPIPSGSSNFTALALGLYHTLALREDGTVAGWGDDRYGQLGKAAGLSNVVAIGTGTIHSLALRSDGAVATWGQGQGTNSAPAAATNIVAATAGSSHNLALRADGRVFSWGFMTNVPAEVSNVVAVAAGGSHSLALRADGTVQAWGSDSSGQTTVPLGLDRVVAIAAGSSHSLALRDDGTVVAWGYNRTGATNVPVHVKDAVAVAAASEESLALLRDGTVVSWGSSFTNLQYTYPGSISPVVAIAAGASRALGLTRAGAPKFPAAQYPRRIGVIGKGASFHASVTGDWPLAFQWRHNGTALPGQTNAWLYFEIPDPRAAGDYTLQVSNELGVAISSPMSLEVVPVRLLAPPADRQTYFGGSPVFSAEAEGIVLGYQWRRNGRDLPGQTNASLVIPNAGLGDVGGYTVSVTTGFGSITSAVVSLTLGPWVVWGQNSSGQTTSPPGLSNVLALANGDAHSLALREDGTVVAWGANESGQSTVPAGLGRVSAIAAGGSSSYAVRLDGTVAAWGDNSFGKTNIPPKLDRVVSLSAGPFHVLALRTDGSVVAWGDNQFGQVTVPVGLSNIVGIAAGRSHSVVVRGDGSVVAWGNNVAGQCTPPPGLGGVVAVSAGAAHTLALRFDGSLAAWGDNRYRQGEAPRDMTNVAGIVAAPVHNIVLLNDGRVAAWGNNFYGQVTPPLGLTNVVVFSTSTSHTVAFSEVGPPRLEAAAPLQRAGTAGSAMFLRFSVSGALPIGYQWRHGGVDLPGETNAVLVLRNLQNRDAGSYTVVARSPFGEVTSPELAVTVAGFQDTSPRLVIEPPASGGAFRISVLGAGDANFDLLKSSDLTVWDLAGVLTNQAGQRFFLGNVTNAPRIFYRLSQR